MKEKNLEITNTNKGRTFCAGDIHGSYKALIQCLERSGFNKENDQLITLGDIVDGWSQTKEVVEELLTIKNRIDIRGNHDDWFVEFINYKVAHDIWTSQGGKQTLESYNAFEEDIPGSHKEFFKNQVYYYIDDQNRLFVHGGYNWHNPFTETSTDNMMWDRKAYLAACQWESFRLIHPTEPIPYFKEFEEVFVGHSATNGGKNWRLGPSDIPLHVSNMWNLDQGAGWFGKLSIMDIDTKEYWQSDPVQELYKDEVIKRR